MNKPNSLPDEEIETIAPLHGRRIEDRLVVVDTTKALTKEELADLKQLASWWRAGRIIAAGIVALGAVAVGAVHVYDLIVKWGNK